jgi:replicative DNA helicase
LSREVEKRKEGAKIPQLSDLRESGAIEQDADMVMFLYRPDYYEIGTNENGESTKGETYVKIAKHRNGSLDTVKLKALLHIQKFIEDEEGSNDFGNSGNSSPTGNYRPVKPSEGGGGASLYIQKGSKMNDGAFDEDAPF